MIKLCQKHFNALVEKWGSIEAIKRAYGDYEIVTSQDCENLDCMKKQGKY